MLNWLSSYVKSFNPADICNDFLKLTEWAFGGIISYRPVFKYGAAATKSVANQLSPLKETG